MQRKTKTPAGVIEGFFGRSWTWTERRQLAALMPELGLDFYLYAPKNDACLRRRWQQPHTQAQKRELLATRNAFRETDTQFGIGLSPLELCTSDGFADTSALTRKIHNLNTYEPDILALLFDDMRGDLPGLAERQSELVKRVSDLTCAEHIILCPTYYSTDPVLEKVFGAAPANYLEDLGKQLPDEVDVFWTGSKVCTDVYDPDQLKNVAAKLNRKPFIWDNYPVNDGAVRSNHLYLSPPGADRALIKPCIAGIAANPMNLFAASLPALAGLGQAMHNPDYNPALAFDTLLEKLFEPEVARTLREDAEYFIQVRLDKMPEELRRQLTDKYQRLAVTSAAAAEITDWLNGGYTFDPACLTD